MAPSNGFTSLREWAVLKVGDVFDNRDNNQGDHIHCCCFLLRVASHLIFACRSFAVTLQRWVEFVRREDRREDHTMFGVLRLRTDESTCSSTDCCGRIPSWRAGGINSADGRQSSRQCKRQTAWR